MQFSRQDSGQEKIFDALERIEGRQIEDEKSLAARAHNILDLKPNFFGIGLNANAAIDELFKWLKQLRAKRKRQEQTRL